MANTSRLDNVISLAKRRGFVFPAGEIYGGTRSAWDYGPLGTALKENIKRQWWRAMVDSRDDIVGIDSSVILPTQVWEASGHLKAFVDPLVECQQCHKRYREDHLIEEFEEKKGREPKGGLDEIACASCGTRGQWTEPKMFNGLLKTYLGVTQDESGLHYLRPETAQGIFVNFENVMRTSRAEASVRHRPDRQELPQRDHARQLHLPHPRVRADGDGVLCGARHRRGMAPELDRHAHGLVHGPGPQRRQPAPVRAPAREALALLEAHRGHRVPLRLPGQRVRRARGHRQPHRLRPQDALRALRQGPVLPGPRHQRALHAVRHRAGRRPHALPHGVPHRGVHRRGGARPPRAAPRPAPCSSSIAASRPSRPPCCRCQRPTH